jgi:multidrug efflux pump subunit AcrB
MKLNKLTGWAAWSVNNYRIATLLTVLLLAFGVYGLYVMPKDEFPPFVVRQGVVIAVMPGATSEEIEAQVARPLERYMFTYKEVNRQKNHHHKQQRNVYDDGADARQHQQERRGVE